MEWLAARQAELLPVPYFHVVFTLPAAIAEIAYQNKAAVYAILFKAVAATLRTIAADPKHLGAEIGIVAVLHTWGQNLHHHPHLHCVVPGGGLSLKPAPAEAGGTRWIACRPGFFLPVRVLSRLFRRLFLEDLQAAFDASDLSFFGDLAELAQKAAFARRLAEVRRGEWVVYATSSRHSQGHGACGLRVHPAFPARHPAGRLPSHPPLRFPCQRPSCREARAVPQVVDSRNISQTLSDSSAASREGRDCAQFLSVLRWDDDRTRPAAAINAMSPISLA
jgi:hypothetical protein